MEVVVVVLMGVICFFLADELPFLSLAVVEPLLDNFCTVSCLNENDLILLILPRQLANCNNS